MRYNSNLLFFATIKVKIVKKVEQFVLFVEKFSDSIDFICFVLSESLFLSRENYTLYSTFAYEECG